MSSTRPGRNTAREYRLSGVGAFETLFRSGRRQDGAHVQLISAPAERLVGRAGFVVARKTVPRAVDRNRFKRLVREALRLARPESARFDLIVRVRAPLRRDQIGDAAREAARLIAKLAGIGP